MSYKEIIDNVSNIEDLDNTTILKVLEKFSKTIKDFAIEQSGLNNLVNVEFIPSDNNTTYTGNSVDYLGTLKLTLSDNIIVNKPCNIKFNIKGSNTIVVDVDEFSNSLELHLDNSVVTTLDFAESERQKSKNLFYDPTDNNKTHSGITFTSSSKNQEYTFNGTSLEPTGYSSTGQNIAKLLAGKTYVLSCRNTGGSRTLSGYFVLYLYCKDTSGNSLTEITLSLGGSNTIYTTTITPAVDTIISAYNFDVASSNSYDNYKLKIQIEENSTATDWQFPYGAIVHEKQIADVEHIETIYDMSSSDSNINKGYTGGIQPGTTISNLALSKYKTLRIWFGNYGILQYQGFLTLSIAGNGSRECQTTSWNLNYQITVNKLDDTSSITNSSGDNCNIIRIEGVY